VKDEFEPAHGANQGGVRQADGQRFAAGARESPGRHRLDVEVARRRIEIAECARAEQPRADETVAKPFA
jgi:hypothetical protein